MPQKTGSSPIFDLDLCKKGLLQGDRVSLGQAITLVESRKEEDRLQAELLIESILPHTGNSVRIGITGSPGVGKSTFIEALGKYLTASGKKVAILTIDPSSQKSKGSILGDKTRMDELSKDPLAFIRPSPSGNALGGVANGTREAILLCEAAGYGIIIIETVGVGQSEVTVREMVDFFLLLMLAGAGDELQGIKKGIMEMADGIVITKADGENKKNATRAQADFQHAIHLFQQSESGWTPKVITSSAFEKAGLVETWGMIESFTKQTQSTGFFETQRNQQRMEWFKASIDYLIKNKMLANAKNIMDTLEKGVLSGKVSPNKAAREVFENTNLG